MDRIGVRELRQNASLYLRRVSQGERLEITDRGRPVAMLVPVVADPWEDLIASGRVTAPEDPGDIADIEPLDVEFDISAELARIREER
jgi:prevent-host-death family protein